MPDPRFQWPPRDPPRPLESDGGQLLYWFYMGVEQPQPNEIIRRGQLYFLAHPGTEIVSGYGLTTTAGRMDHLVGLLMVDRPRPVDPAAGSAVS
jgi:hypothetical protein